jgi:hypothetical protein
MTIKFALVCLRNERLESHVLGGDLWSSLNGFLITERSAYQLVVRAHDDPMAILMEEFGLFSRRTAQ